MNFIQIGTRWINMEQVFSVGKRNSGAQIIVRSQAADQYEVFEGEEAQLLKMYLSHRSVQLKRYQPLLEEGDGCTTASD